MGNNNRTVAHAFDVEAHEGVNVGALDTTFEKIVVNAVAGCIGRKIRGGRLSEFYDDGI